ncbi:MAG: PD-(D/E)XK nuclease family protein [Gemmatimonadetes bacterium]|nr:PD-(D/E)XK nuclease family protein [Gemmatimonadota bacterium]
MEVTDRPILLEALAAVARAHPLARKLLVCRRPGEGRELLRALAAGGQAWVGFEVTTLWQLAQSMAGAQLAAAGLALIDEFDQAALLDEAMDRVLRNGVGGRLAELAEGTGRRQAGASAGLALRLAGIDAAMLGRTRRRDEDKRAQLARLLTGYEDLLARRGLTDVAGTFRTAVASLSVGDIAPPAGHIYLLPGLSRRGLSGQLLDALVERGAEVLPEEPVHGLPSPVSRLQALAVGPGKGGGPLAWLHAVAEAPPGGAPGLTLFAATSVSAELREVLRRVLAAGLRWDQVEIVATDPVTYCVALDGLARRLGIPVTYAVGLPVARTRPGRAVAKYLEWVAGEFPADVLRGLIERGDLEPPGGSGDATRLAQELRRLRIGRGRERYEAALARAERVLARLPAPEDERSPQELAEDRSRRVAALAALGGLVRVLLAATPVLPDRLEDGAQRVAPAALAAGVRAMLAHVPCRDEVERTVQARLTQRLERIERTATRRVPLAAAVALLLARLDARVPAPAAAGGLPWSAAGGHVHLSDLEHGGHTQRAATFVVGLDAVRFPGAGLHDALLVDDDRRRLTAEQAVPALPTAADRVEEKRYALAALLARLRGAVTLSYSTWDAVEGRSIPPAAELLQAWRLRSGQPAADYDALHAALAPAASAIPHGVSRLDEIDVWLGAMADGGTLRFGVPVVRAAYPWLDAGWRAGAQATQGDVLNAYHGAIAPRSRLDPRQNPELPVSASQLETIGQCPHRYLLRHVLHIRPPADPEFSPEQWLGPLERGALLHRVYERALTAVARKQVPLEAPEFEQLVQEVLEDELARQRSELPPPGEAIYALEADALRDDGRAFVELVREDGARWVLPLERRFGGRDGTAPLAIALPGGAIRVWGAIDRIDRLEDGRLAVIDYKTGSTRDWGPKSGPYHGGRRLQHVLYAAAAGQLEGAAVARAEYQFPTRRAENHRVSFDAPVLRAGLAVADTLLGLVARGQLHPTTDPEDCRFCDYQAVCRARERDYGRMSSPRAEWARNGRMPELQVLRELRK